MISYFFTGSLTESRADLLAADQGFYDDIQTVINNITSSTTEADLRIGLNSVMQARANYWNGILEHDSEATVPTDLRTTFIYSDTSDAEDVFNYVVEDPIIGKEKVVDAWLDYRGITSIDENSKERAVLVSLAYNNLIHETSGSPSLAAAILGENRAEAWYEIRYDSNGGNSQSDGIAKRRYYESDIFGLYDESNSSEDQAKQIFQMMTKHHEKIETYEDQYSSQIGEAENDYGTDLQTTDEALLPAKTTLANLYNVPLGSIDKIWIDYTLNVDGTGSETNNLDFSTRTENALFIGGEGNDFIHAGTGNDVLHGEAGDDTLVGEAGNDILDGGTGIDKADYHLSMASSITVDINEGLILPDVTVTGDELFVGTDELHSIEKIVGTAGNDTFNLKTVNILQELELDGSIGRDVLKIDMGTGALVDGNKVDGTDISWKNIEEVQLTAFDDVIKRAVDETVYYTRDGNDIINSGSIKDDEQIYIADASASDQIINFGEVLTGGKKWHGSESAWTQWTDGVKYGINQLGELVIENLLGGSVFAANFNNDPFASTNALTAGIKLYELAWGAYLIFREAPPEWGTFHDTPETLAFVIKEINREANPAYDPLVLDLDGDGIELTTLSSFAPQFDLNADGFAERAGWVSGDDGMLTIDLNSNGTIDNGSELFGNATIGGLAALSAYDTDLDGSITAADAAFSSLKIWRDLDQDGVSDANELKTLSESDIQSISLTPTSTTATLQAGNTIAATGTYTKTDGSTGTTGDVVLNSNGYDTKWLGSVTVSPEISAMANLKGHGTLPDLHQAMALDSDLVTVVNSVLPTLTTPDLDVLRANVIPFLSAWMASVDVPAGMPGTQARIDVPIKVTSDAVHGPQVQDFAIQKSDTNGTYWALASGAAVVDELGNPIARPTLADIQAQGGTWDTLPASVISFMERWTGLHMPIGLDGGETGSDAVNGAKDLANTIWQELQMITVRLASQGGLAGYFEGISYDVGSDKFVPTTDTQLVPFIQNIFEAAPGTASGDQAWLQSWKPLVDVVLNDYDRPGSAEVSYSYLFQNVVAAYENSPLEISLTTAAAAFSVPSSQIVTGTGTMTGTDDNDLFYLGEGDQIAQGGKGPDSYIVGRNFGQDIIDDTEHTLGTDLPDSVRFAHLKSTDVTLTRDQSDLIISVNGTADQLRIVGEFATRYPSLTGYINDTHGVSELVFADGVVWDKVDMARESSHPEATNDIIYGTGQIDFLDGGAGNDHLSGGNEGDVYIYGTGYGHDVISEADTEFSVPNPDIYETSISVLIKNPDILKFKDLTLDDVTFTRSGDKNLLISANGATDTLLITNQFRVRTHLIT